MYRYRGQRYDSLSKLLSDLPGKKLVTIYVLSINTIGDFIRIIEYNTKYVDWIVNEEAVKSFLQQLDSDQKKKFMENTSITVLRSNFDVEDHIEKLKSKDMVISIRNLLSAL